MTRTTVRTFLILFVAAAVAATAIPGCSKQEAPPQPVVKKIVPREQAKPAEPPKVPEAQAAKPAGVLYNPAGKRDPFTRFLKVEPKATRAYLDSVPPLQRYDIGELKFVGVIWGGKGVHALVEDAEGKGYRVTVGSKIGRGKGVVTRITEEEIFVKEQFEDRTGTVVAKESVMTLQKAGGKSR